MYQNFFCNWKLFFIKKSRYLFFIFTIFSSFLAILSILLILNYQNVKRPFLNYSNDNVSAEIAETEEKMKLDLALIVVDIGGAVKNSGVYQLAYETRLADLVEKAGGFQENEIDKLWLQKNLNLAEKLVDGKKYYIPYLEESISSLDKISVNKEEDTKEKINNLISINQATLKTLTTLPGVGEARGQAIIDGRPYLEINDLLKNKIVTEAIFEKIKNLIFL